MIKRLQIQLIPELAAEKKLLYSHIASNINEDRNNIKHIEIIRRSIDARNKIVKINLTVDIYINESYKKKEKPKSEYKDVSNAREVVIIGAGPAGLFAALKLLERGIKPIILERGKDVRSRRRDIALLTKEHIVNEDSNYCFGEGGAGTFSDGKLYTRSKKRGDVNKILDVLIEHGANPDIAIDAHPHIGTNKLPNIIRSIRKTILEYGGQIHFNSLVVDIGIKNKKINYVLLKDGTKISTNKVILATGHSARDIFKLLYEKKIELESKDFSLGVRIEHSQELIDSIQYNCQIRNEYLPPASYSLVKQIKNRGIYSFCMCPGGVIAPCATENGQVVTNGWSPAKRNFISANSGIVVQLTSNDFKKYNKYGPLSGMFFQQEIEEKACQIAGGSQKAPAQRLLDFMNNNISNHIPKTSYIPGVSSVNISDIFPNNIIEYLKSGLYEFDKSMKGYLTNDAIVHAPETRTSSPIRIPRKKDTLEHVVIDGLYPCGEGAGYAGGIMSAAIDGQRCAEKC